jgi:hypothetical protein
VVKYIAFSTAYNIKSDKAVRQYLYTSYYPAPCTSYYPVTITSTFTSVFWIWLRCMAIAAFWAFSYLRNAASLGWMECTAICRCRDYNNESAICRDYDNESAIHV